MVVYKQMGEVLDTQFTIYYAHVDRRVRAWVIITRSIASSHKETF